MGRNDSACTEILTPGSPELDIWEGYLKVLSVPEPLRKQKDRGHLTLEKPEKLTNSVSCTILLSKYLGAFYFYISFGRKGKILVSAAFLMFSFISFISFHMLDWFKTMCIHWKGFKRWSKDRENRHWCSIILSRLNYLMLVCINTCSWRGIQILHSLQKYYIRPQSYVLTAETSNWPFVSLFSIHRKRCSGDLCTRWAKLSYSLASLNDFSPFTESVDHQKASLSIYLPRLVNVFVSFVMEISQFVSDKELAFFS